MRLVLAPWEWHTDPSGDAYWRKPGGDYRGGCLDLRSRVEAGVPGPTASGLGLFAYEDLPQGIQVAADLGDDPLAALTPARRRDLGRALGLDPSDIGGATLSQALAEFVLGSLADPSGQARTKPLRMNRRGCRLHLKGFGRIYRHVIEKGHPTYQRTLAVRRLDYERHRQRGRTPLDVLQKWTGWDMRALSASEDELLPQAFRADGSRAPSTTLTESWPTDSTTLSTGQDEPWTELNGDASVAAGKLGAVTNGANVNLVCDTSLSSDDHYHSADYAQVANNNRLMVAVRHDGGETTELADNAYGVFVNRSTPAVSLFKWASASATLLDTDANDPGATGTMECRADGSTITGETGTVTGLSATDTDITGNLQCGCWVRKSVTAAHADSTLDDHTMEDLAAPAASVGGAWYYRQQQAALLAAM